MRFPAGEAHKMGPEAHIFGEAHTRLPGKCIWGSAYHGSQWGSAYGEAQISVPPSAQLPGEVHKVAIPLWKLINE